MPYDEIWHFSTARFRVSFGVMDSVNPDLSWCNETELADIRDGDLLVFDSRVAVYCDGEMIGASYLCESIYGNPREFIGDVYFRGLVREAMCCRAAAHGSPS